MHPDWKIFNEKYDADIAIFVLSDNVEFTKYIRPICMPEDDVEIDTMGSIVGNAAYFNIVISSNIFDYKGGGLQRTQQTINPKRSHGMLLLKF